MEKFFPLAVIGMVVAGAVCGIQSLFIAGLVIFAVWMVIAVWSLRVIAKAIKATANQRIKYPVHRRVGELRSNRGGRPGG